LISQVTACIGSQYRVPYSIVIANRSSRSSAHPRNSTNPPRPSNHQTPSSPSLPYQSLVSKRRDLREVYQDSITRPRAWSRSYIQYAPVLSLRAKKGKHRRKQYAAGYRTKARIAEVVSYVLGGVITGIDDGHGGRGVYMRTIAHWVIRSVLDTSSLPFAEIVNKSRGVGRKYIAAVGGFGA
jgi:hypothetical protein